MTKTAKHLMQWFELLEKQGYDLEDLELNIAGDNPGEIHCVYFDRDAKLITFERRGCNND